MNINDLIIDFLEYLEVEKNRSVLTIRNYEHYLNRFTEFAGDINPNKISPELIRKYRLFLNRYPTEDNKGLKKITQNYHIIALRAFLKYLSKRDIPTLTAEKVELGSNEKRTIDFLEADEVERILAAPYQVILAIPTKVGRDRNQDSGPSFASLQTGKQAGMTTKETLIYLRDKAILETLFSTGLRVSELVSLNRKQINLDRGELLIKGKGGKERIVFLSERAKDSIKNYLNKREDNFEPLFVRFSKGGVDEGEYLRLTSRSIQRMIKKYAALAGILKKVTPHVLRHSFATDLLVNGADIRSVQEMLGHASITTTQIYTHITNQKLRGVHQKYHRKRTK
ncbi:MAG: tyrosine-type recombinase/integrase [Patescibacteria group bacterium]|nr:tyrosine-type recombinase/integrase [Patescibacteria group bacterium]